jgi:hypothetical protein
VTSPGGYVLGWLLAFFGVAIVATLTAAIVGFGIDFLLQEGQGVGASGYSDHIVVCGWNATARELIGELRGDEFPARIVVLHESERSAGGADVYVVRGGTTSTADLERAGIPDAAAAVICPSDATHEADRRPILTVLAMETMARKVRTVVEVNHPKHVDHVRRAHADEILVTWQLASRLLPRTAHYPGWRSSSPTSCPGATAACSTGSSCSTTTPTSASTTCPPGDRRMPGARGQCAPSRRAATRASARATCTTSASGTDSRGACASRTSPGP